MRLELDGLGDLEFLLEKTSFVEKIELLLLRFLDLLVKGLYFST